MIDANAPVKSPPRITRDKFIAVMDDAGSPWAALASSLYNLIVGRKHDPAFWLAVCGREHSFGTNHDSVLWRNQTNSWTNARTVRDPDVKKRATIITDPVRKSRYVKYQTVADSLIDGMYRIEDPTFDYQQAGATTIGAVLAIWTEAEAAEYTAFVVDRINEWSTPVGFEMPGDINGIPVIKRFIPAGQSNRPGTPATASGQQWITVHETANTSKGADAKMHNAYVFNGGGADTANGNDGVSFTFVVDDHSIYWNLPLEEKSWQASDGANGDGNSSVSIETCVNADGNWDLTKTNLSRLLAFLVVNVPNKSVERIAQHNKWARDHKNCPTRLRANENAEWNLLLSDVRNLIVGGGVFPPVEDPPLLLPGSAFPVVLGFKGYLLGLAQARYPQDTNAAILSIVGLPQAPEYRGKDGNVYQVFERTILQFDPHNAPPFDIVMLRRDDEAPEAA